MEVYKNVLVAIDLSDEAHFVLRKAAALVAQWGGVIQVVHVADMPMTGYGPMIGHPVDGDMNLQEDLLETVRAMTSVYGVPAAAVHVLLGHPATAITDLARKSGSDLVIIGSHGRHGVRVLLGSTANAVLNASNCDCLLVRIVR